MKPTEQNKTRANKSLFKKFIAMLVIGLTAALYPTNIYSQCPTTPVPPPCASGANKTLYSNFSSPYDWTEATGIFATGEQMTIRPAAFSTSTNLFVSEYLFRSDGGRLAQLSPIFPAGGSNPSYNGETELSQLVTFPICPVKFNAPGFEPEQIPVGPFIEPPTTKDVTLIESMLEVAVPQVPFWTTAL